MFRGEYPDGRALSYGVKGRYDPGYGSTSRMLAETGMALLESDGRARFRGGDAVPKARTRWWVINRIDRGCRPVYTASRPVVSGNIAFVSVLAGHWGTTYAVEKRGKSWVTTAKWRDWLY